MIKLTKADPSSLHHLSKDLSERVEAFCEVYGKNYVLDVLDKKISDALYDTVSLCIDSSAKSDKYPTSSQLSRALVSIPQKKKGASRVEQVSEHLQSTFKRLDLEVLTDIAITYTSNEKENSKVAIAQSLVILQKLLAIRLVRQSAHYLLASYLLARMLKDHDLKNPISFKYSGPSGSNPLMENWWKISRLYSNLTSYSEIFKEFEWIFSPYSESLGSMNPALTIHCNAFERWCEKTEEVLGGTRYDYSALEEDAWAEVYQEYLGPQERQRLGSFFTPGDLVDLLLDGVKYHPSDCKESYDHVLMDPTCGSGSFLVSASHRLLKAIRIRHKNSTKIIDEYCSRLVANDVHRFATFLTGINLIFPLIKEISKARAKSKKYRVPLKVYSEDFLRLDFRKGSSGSGLMKEHGRVSLIVGNPPWGGVGKGWEGPLYDANERLELQNKFGKLWNDKIDVYSLFTSNVLRFVKEGGGVSFLIQSSFLDKKFAKPLRQMCLDAFTPLVIIDLSGQGGSFFKKNTAALIKGKTSKKRAMNVPMGLILKKEKVSPQSKSYFRAITTRNSLTTKEENAGDLKKLIETIYMGLKDKKKLKKRIGAKVTLDAFNIPLSDWSKWSSDVWRLDADLECRQILKYIGNVPFLSICKTQRGAGALGDEIFEKVVKDLKSKNYAGSGYYQAQRGDDITRGVSQKSREMVCYPYTQSGQTMFKKDNLLSPECSLQEKRVLKTKAYDLISLIRIRKSEGKISDEEMEYGLSLAKYYEELSSRTAATKGVHNITHFGKLWYEWWRPRKPAVMLSSPKIVAQRITKRPVTGIDLNGFLPYETVIVSVPIKDEFNKWLKEWAVKLHRKSLDDMDGLAIIACWLNSAPVRALHIIGRIPRPGGVREFTEDLSKEIYLPSANQKKYNREVTAFVKWALNWKKRPQESCFDPLGKKEDMELAKIAGWKEPNHTT